MIFSSIARNLLCTASEPPIRRGKRFPPCQLKLSAGDRCTRECLARDRITRSRLTSQERGTVDRDKWFIAPV